MCMSFLKKKTFKLNANLEKVKITRKCVCPFRKKKKTFKLNA